MSIFSRENLTKPSRCLVVAEIGINHNGDLETAFGLIRAAAEAGCDAVKFQKRTVSAVYSGADLSRPRKSPFGTTNGDLKYGLEFGVSDYECIADECMEWDLPWFASCWDERAVCDIAPFGPPAFKIASASLTDDTLLRHIRLQGKPVILSTGMSTVEQIDHAVDVLGTEELTLLHCVSTYPAKNTDINLRCMQTLRDRYGIPVGYSGHETGLPPSLAAFVMGACLIERHITLDRAGWGSDQSASVEPQGMARLVREIGICRDAMGDGVKRVLDEEQPIITKLRRV